MVSGLFHAEPQVVFVGPAAMEPPGVPVDAGHLADEPQVRPLLGEEVMELVRQSAHGLIELGEIGLLVGFKPAALIVEADAPHEVHGLVGKSGKHSAS